MILCNLYPHLPSPALLVKSDNERGMVVREPGNSLLVPASALMALQVDIRDNLNGE